MNAPGANSISVAELAIGLMLAMARKIPQIDREMWGGAWPREMLTQATAKTLGVFGTGAIGSRTAELGRGLGMDVLTWSAQRDTPAAKDDILRRDFGVASGAVSSR